MFVKIQNQKYKLYYDDPKDWAADGMGRSNSLAGTININKNMPKTMQDNTLIHEVIHMITENNQELFTEQQVALLGLGVYDFIMQNKNIIRSMIGDK